MKNSWHFHPLSNFLLKQEKELRPVIIKILTCHTEKLNLPLWKSQPLPWKSRSLTKSILTFQYKISTYHHVNLDLSSWKIQLLTEMQFHSMLSNSKHCSYESFFCSREVTLNYTLQDLTRKVRILILIIFLQKQTIFVIWKNKEKKCILIHNSCFCFTFIEFLNLVLINVIAIVMMLTKLTAPGLLKTNLFWKKGCDVIISAHNFTIKIL